MSPVVTLRRRIRARFEARSVAKPVRDQFDSAFYLAANPELQDRGLTADEALLHYLQQGWRQGLDPAPDFSTLGYLQRYPDVREMGVDPLTHYCVWGRHEGRQPVSPAEHAAQDAPDAPKAPDAPEAPDGVPNRDAGEATAAGETAGAADTAGPTGAAAARPPSTTREAMDLLRPHFDAAHYLRRNPDVAARLSDPEEALWHYVAFGARERRDPAPDFNVDFYLLRNPDVGAINVDPFVHYVLYGRAEGRPALPGPQDTDYRSCRDPAAEAAWQAANREPDRRWRAMAALLETGDGDALAEAVPRANPLLEAGVDLDRVAWISFDVFDTLLERRCGRPDAVFEIWEHLAGSAGGVPPPHLSRARRAAEAEARRRMGRQEITLDLIYAVLKRELPLTDAAADRLKQLELAVERRLCRTRPDAMAAYRTAVALGKGIVFTTDTYLPRGFVEELLRDNGCLHYDLVLASSETGAMKHHGDAFAALMHRLGVPASRILHIGDNLHSDRAMAARYGVRNAGVPPRRTTPAAALEAEDAPPETQAYSPPWYAVCEALGQAKTGELCPEGVDAHRDVGTVCYAAGYRGLGPALLGFAQFVAQTARLHGYRRLFFVARDGFYLQRAYELLRDTWPDLPPAHYLLSSRRVARLVSIHTLQDALAVARVDHHPMPLRRLLLTRFALSDRDLQAVDRDTCARVGLASLDDTLPPSARASDLQPVIAALWPAIAARAREQRACYAQYLADLGVGGSDAIVDIGYRGTAQRAVHDATGLRIGGLYLMTWPEVDSLLQVGLRFDAFVARAADASDPLVHHVPLLELMLSATHGSLVGFRRDATGVVPVHDDGPSDGPALAALNRLRRGALDFAVDHLDLLPDFARLGAPGGETGIRAFLDLAGDPPPQLAFALSGLRVDDPFGGDGRPLVERPDPAGGEGAHAATLGQGSCWKAGTRALARWRSRALRAGWRLSADAAGRDAYERASGALRPAVEAGPAARAQAAEAAAPAEAAELRS